MKLDLILSRAHASVNNNSKVSEGVLSWFLVLEVLIVNKCQVCFVCRNKGNIEALSKMWYFWGHFQILCKGEYLIHTLYHYPNQKVNLSWYITNNHMQNVTFKENLFAANYSPWRMFELAQFLWQMPFLTQHSPFVQARFRH